MASTDRVHLLADLADGVDGNTVVEQLYQDCIVMQVRGVIVRSEGNVVCQLEGEPSAVAAARNAFFDRTDLKEQHQAALEQSVEPRLTALVAHIDDDLFLP